MIRRPQYKICRMVGDKIFPKCQTQKFAVSQAKKTRKGRPGGKSEYAAQLTEKQKVKFTYGLTERQFVNEVEGAQEKKGMNASDVLYKNLETRLDNVLFRLGVVLSRSAARQLVSHGHILVNSRKVTIPSYKVRIGDVVSVRKGSAGIGIFKDLVERLKGYSLPEWLQFSMENMAGTIKSMPLRSNSTVGYDMASVLEFYGRS